MSHSRIHFVRKILNLSFQQTLPLNNFDDFGAIFYFRQCELSSKFIHFIFKENFSNFHLVRCFYMCFYARKDEKNMHRLISVLINENLIKITVCCRNLIRSAKCLSNFYICEMLSDSYSEMSQQKILKTCHTRFAYTL